VVSSARPILVTGARGFVGGWLLANLAATFPHTPVISISAEDGANPDAVLIDIRDEQGIDALIRKTLPSAVIHLAALSFVPDAEADPKNAYNVNLFGTLNLAQSVLRHAPDCRFVFVGSAEVYAGTFRAWSRPVDESAPLDPVNVYASTKAAADMLVGQLAYRGLQSVRFRPFNHVGPGQADRFVVPSFVNQIVAAERGQQEPIIRVGNLESFRDFLDVRDVVAGYVAAVTREEPLPPGTIINLASGIPRKISEILDFLVQNSTIDIRVERDDARFRPADFPFAVGSPQRAMELLGWSPRFNFEDTLLEILSNARLRHSAHPS